MVRSLALQDEKMHQYLRAPTFESIVIQNQIKSVLNNSISRNNSEESQLTRRRDSLAAPLLDMKSRKSVAIQPEETTLTV